MQKAATNTNVLAAVVGLHRPPKSYSILVTPEMAAHWLNPKLHPNNRRLRPVRVEFFATRMRTGQFKFTGEPIQFVGFLDDGTAMLVNGQHRLRAVVVTGLAQPFLVVEGVDPGVMPYLDTGARRSLSDSIQLRGLRNSGTLAAVIRGHYILNHPNDRKTAVNGGGTFFFSFEDLLQWYDSRADLFDKSLYYGRTVKEVFKANGSAVSVAWMLITEEVLRRQTDSDVDEFFMRLIQEGPTGAEVDSKGTNQPGLYLLRRWLTNNVTKAGRGKRPRSILQSAIIVKGWNMEQQMGMGQYLAWKTTGKSVEDFPDPVVIGG